VKRLTTSIKFTVIEIPASTMGITKNPILLDLTAKETRLLTTLVICGLIPSDKTLTRSWMNLRNSFPGKLTYQDASFEANIDVE